ncbi:MAG: hypothetical protein GC190_16310 [Alphaproteobacteria bacterium]|nr:hypothetical protein [Alphaproteobacteria bacterium]
MRNTTIVIAASALALAIGALAGQAADAAARCKSLSAQWDAAEAANGSSPDLGRAKAWAKAGARDCSRDSASRRSDGVDEYTKALEILGVAVH